MAHDSLRRNLWSLVKWALGTIAGTIGFLEIAPRYEEWKASVWSLISGLPPSSAVWWDIIRIALIIVGVSIVLSDILPRIRSKPKPTTKPEAQQVSAVSVASNAEKLKALSPIHMMIMAIERVSPRAASLGLGAGDGIGRFVRYDTPNLNLDQVRSAFSEYAHVLGDRHLKEWLKFTEEIRRYADRNGFWVGKREWKWFDELEREYQDARIASLRQTAPEIEVKRREFTEEDVGPPFPLEGVASFVGIPNIEKTLRDWLGKELPGFCNVQVKSMDQSQDWSEIRGIVQDSDLSFYHFALRLDSKGKIDRKESYVK